MLVSILEIVFVQKHSDIVFVDAYALTRQIKNNCSIILFSLFKLYTSCSNFTHFIQVLHILFKFCTVYSNCEHNAVSRA